MRAIFLKTGRSFYGVALIVYGVQQFLYGDFRNVQLPAWQSHLPFLPAWAYSTGAGLVWAGLAIITGKKGREVALALGGVFLSLVVLVHIPFGIFSEPYHLHLAVWTSALKELALAGGAFIIAGTFKPGPAPQSGILAALEKAIPLGPLFFSITMASFGTDHFLYAERLSNIVPSYFPDRVFWMYLTGVVLLGAGISIALNIRRGAVALLFSVTLFMWVILLHIPRVIADPFGSRANEISSVFDALAFCGTAIIIASQRLKRDVSEIFTQD